jgi:hypothetical protein
MVMVRVRVATKGARPSVYGRNSWLGLGLGLQPKVQGLQCLDGIYSTISVRE